MSDTATAPAVTDSLEAALHAARELNWEDGLVEAALAKGFSLQEVWQALSAQIDGEVAKQFLAQSDGGGFIKPSFEWMNVPTQWGVRARPKDPAMGLTISDLNIGTYGDIPDVWTIRSEIARGSYPAATPLEDMGYTIFEKAPIWADCVVELYEVAIRDRWSSATDLNWSSLEELPSDLERAVCQVMTEQSERAYFEAALIAGWLPEISYGYHELKFFLSTVIYDLQRHSEAFRKRALANGGGLGLQAPTNYNRAAKEARSYPELMAILFVQDSMLLTLWEHGEQFAQNQLERDLYAFCARDRSRLMQYHTERLRHFLFKMQDRREEQNLYFHKAEYNVAKEWRDTTVSEPLAILLGGGRDNIEAGMEKLKALRKKQVEDYVARLADGLFVRTNLNAQLRAFAE